ncbi:MAG: DUF1580 domain-containing protein [Planctomycetaceae bacterium]|nr:DUF1580 domain-containing protein [Planctomycetaceae bacterium]
MIDLDAETLISLPEAAEALPNKPCLTTMHRWRVEGIAGVKLETLKIGHRRYTSREAVRRFITESTAASEREVIQPEMSEVSERTPETERRLRDVGVL